MDKERNCWDCKIILPIEKFGLWKYGKNGRRNQCKSCKNKEQAIRQKTSKGKIKNRLYKIKYRNSSKYRNLLKSDKYKIKAAKWHKDRYIRDRKKVRARYLVKKAIKHGIFPRANTMKCFSCK